MSSLNRKYRDSFVFIVHGVLFEFSILSTFRRYLSNKSLMMVKSASLSDCTASDMSDFANRGSRRPLFSLSSKRQRYFLGDFLMYAMHRLSNKVHL